MNGLEAIIFDFGDTLADEGSEEKDRDGVTLRADLFPGTLEALHDLYRRGYRLGLLADCVPGTGRASYDNVLGQHGLRPLFPSIVTSDDAGADKPDRRMFSAILGEMRAESSPVIMVGNRLDRDIAGGNRAGMITVWARMSTRYRQEPEGPDEVADFEFSDYQDLVGLIRQIEEK